MSTGPIPRQDPMPDTEPATPPPDAPVGAPIEGIAEPVAEPTAAPAAESVAEPSSGPAAPRPEPPAGPTAETAAERASEAVVVPPAPVVPVEPVEPVPLSAPAGPVVRPSGRARATAVARRVLSFGLMTALLVLGVAIGHTAFVVDQPAPPVVGDPATRDVPAPPSVQEFVVALRLDDEDAIRAALPPDPYKQYTAEMQNWSFQEVTSVETLSTFADGPRAATHLILVGLNTDGLPVTINLTVVTDGGAIVKFR